MAQITELGKQMFEKEFGQNHLSYHNFIMCLTDETLNESAQVANELKFSKESDSTESNHSFEIFSIMMNILYYFADKENYHFNDENDELNAIDAILMSFILENMVRKELIVAQGNLLISNPDSRLYLKKTEDVKSEQLTKQLLKKIMK